MINNPIRATGGATEKSPNVTTMLLIGMVVLAFFGLAEAQQEGIYANRITQSGVVVESVKKDSQADKAGLRPGDILLSSTFGGVEKTRSIQSPFDLFQSEIDLPAWGNLIIEGTRGAQRSSWTLRASPFGLTTRPMLSSDLLDLYDQSRLLADQGKSAEAAAHWRSLASVRTSPPYEWLNAWLLVRAAESFSASHRWEEADAFYQDAVREAKAGNPVILSLILQMWGVTFLERSNWARAEQCYQESIAASEKVNDETMVIARGIQALGIIARNRGDLVKAEEHARKSLTMKERIAPGSLTVASSFLDLGTIHWLQGDLTAAEDFYRRSLDINQRLSPGSLYLANNLANLGLVSWRRGKADEAEQYFLEATRIRQSLEPESPALAAYFINLAAVVRSRGELERAEDYYHRALAIQEKIHPDDLDVALSLNGLGIVAASQGKLANADEYCLRALSIQQKLAPGSLDVALSLSNLGDIARFGGKLAKADEYYQRALQIQQAIAPDSPDYSNTLHNLAELAYKRADLNKAAEYYEMALAIRRKLSPEGIDFAESLSGLASVYQRKGQLEVAASFFEQALTALEKQTAHLGGPVDAQSWFRARHSHYYLNYIDLLMAQKQPEKAFQVLERWHARSLVELLIEAHVDIRNGVAPELLKQARTLEETLAAKSNLRLQLLNKKRAEEAETVQKETDEVLNQLQQVEGQMRASSSAYAALSRPPSITVNEAQEELLDNDTLLLEYALGEEHSYVWVLQHTSMTTYQLPKRSEIERAARRWYNLLTVRNHVVKSEAGIQRHARLMRMAREQRRAAVLLSQMILGPMGPELGRKRLLVVSDGALQYIPFCALPDPGVSSNFKAGLPLIAGHEVVNLPSASVLSVLRREATGRKRLPHAVAVLADPVFDEKDARVTGAPVSARRPPESKLERASASFPLRRSASDVGFLQFGRLPFSRKEAKAILSVAPDGEVMEALDFEASRRIATSTELKQYRIVHFATHGLLDSKHPELSGLVLSLVNQQGKPENGFLGLQDIYNLKLPAELIVLSACDTGLGKEVRGEGLVGLTRGFMHGGATRIVASLWSIDDAATSELMGRFYKAMFRKGLSPASALRSAQIQMWKQNRFSDPYYWAAFTIQGEWKGSMTGRE